MKKLLKINSSARKTSSTTRDLVDALTQKLSSDETIIIDRDLVDSHIPLLTEETIGAFYTPPQQRTAAQKSEVVVSDKLVEELKEADTIVIGLPIYNFSVPAALKAWIDLVARVGVTFKYTENGPQGLLENKKAYIVVASGGTQFQGNQDYASDYIKQFLGFIGISDVQFISADQQMVKGATQVEAAHKTIQELAA